MFPEHTVRTFAAAAPAWPVLIDAVEMCPAHDGQLCVLTACPLLRHLCRLMQRQSSV